MKRLSACLIIILVLGGILGLAIQGATSADGSAVGSAVELISPAIGYADTLFAVPDPPPPPPIDD